MTAYDAILIPGGGLLPDGSLPQWVENRLDRALRVGSTRFFLTLSRGTVYKAPPSDSRGFPVDESLASANYLLEQGVPEDQILVERTSYDTIGNAYFARVMHLDPMMLRRLLIITSEFHMNRVQRVFEWVCSLSADNYELAFESVPNVGIDAASLAARELKEEQSLRHLRKLIDSITTMRQLHHWLFFEHKAYRPRQGKFDIGGAVNTY